MLGVLEAQGDYDPCDSPYNQSPEEISEDILKAARIVCWVVNGIVTSFLNANEVTRLVIVLLGAVLYNYYITEPPVSENRSNMFGRVYKKNNLSI